MKKILIFLADGLEEIEAITQIDLLRRANLEVTTCSITDKKEIIGSHDIKIISDEVIVDIKDNLYDMVVLPGGQPGTDNLNKNNFVKEILMNHNKKNKFIASICAAPVVFSNLNLLKNKNYTCYPTYKDKINGKQYIDCPVVVENNIITGKGVGTAIPFGLKLIEILSDKNISNDIKEKIVY